ncbi:MAG: lytic transglycosylase domain-containing protein [Candidatus Eremiobacterota bacterium]
MKRPFLYIILLILIITAAIKQAEAGKYIAGDNSRNIINHYLTLDKIHKWEKESSYNRDSLEKLRYYSGQSVFWTGYIKKFKKKNGYSLILNTGKEEIPVYYSNEKTRNLEFNRNGCKAGIKGKIVIKNDRFSYIEGKSAVMLLPPPGRQYRDFQTKYRIKSSFTLNTRQGAIEIKDDFYPFIIHWTLFLNPHYDRSLAETIGKATVYYGHKYNIDPELLLALFTIESAMDYDAVSSGGAVGIGQLMPFTSQALGVDPYDPFQNIGGAAIHFKGSLDEWAGYDNSLDLSLAAYNAGSGAVSSYGGIPPYSETQNYVFFVKFMYEHFKRYSHLPR